MTWLHLVLYFIGCTLMYFQGRQNGAELGRKRCLEASDDFASKLAAKGYEIYYEHGDRMFVSRAPSGVVLGVSPKRSEVEMEAELHFMKESFK